MYALDFMEDPWKKDQEFIKHFLLFDLATISNPEEDIPTVFY